MGADDGLPRELEPCQEVICLTKAITVNENILSKNLGTVITTLK
jgi:hypothetical protein